MRTINYYTARLGDRVVAVKTNGYPRAKELAIAMAPNINNIGDLEISRESIEIEDTYSSNELILSWRYPTATLFTDYGMIPRKSKWVLINSDNFNSSGGSIVEVFANADAAISASKTISNIDGNGWSPVRFEAAILKTALPVGSPVAQSDIDEWLT